MKQKEKKLTELPKIPREELLAQVASQVKGKDLFPKKTGEAKKILSRARIVK